MKIKLVINGEDQRVRLTPSDALDRKILEIITERNTATLVEKKDIYSRELDYVDLVLDEIKPDDIPLK